MTLLLLLLAMGPLNHPLEPAHARFEVHRDHLTLTLSHATDATRPTFAAPCEVELLPPRLDTDPEKRATLRERWACVPATLTLIAGHRDPPVVVEVVDDKNTHTTLLDATSPTLVLNDDTSPFGTWLWLGAEHLLMGLDHVLLVVGLVFLIGLRKELLLALTAFTLGHSLSLALATTHILTLPPALVETAIAGTLVVLALDLVTRQPSPFTKAPWLMGLGVGLIHGLGFAGVLGELGLPEDHAAVALLAFNLGLELAQLALVAALALVFYIRLPVRPLAHVSGWLIGTLGSAWVLERAFSV